MGLTLNPTIPPPPSGFTLDTTIPPPPSGFTLDAPDALDTTIPPPPPGFMLDAPEPIDQSTAGGDIQAGIAQARTIIPGLRVAKGAGLMDQQDSIGGVQYADKEAAQLTQQADALELELPNLPDDETRAQVADEITLLRQQVAQYGAAATTSSTRERQGALDRTAADGASLIAQNAPLIQQQMAEASAIPMNPAAQRFAQPQGDTTWEKVKDMGGAFADDPGGVARTFALRSLPASAPTIAAGVLGSIAGPGGAAAAASLVGGATEKGASVAQSISEELTALNIDPNDKAAVEAWAMENPEAVTAMVTKATQRAVAIGAMDAVTGGATGALARSAAQAGKGTRVAATVGGGVVEAAGEGAGEASAQMLTDGKIDVGEIGAEIVGGGATGAITTAGQTVVEAMKQDRQPTSATPEPSELLDTLPEGFTLDEQGDTADAATSVAKPEISAQAPVEQTITATADAQTEPTDAPDAPDAVDGPVEQPAEQPTEQPTEQVEAPTRSKIYTPDNEEIEVETTVMEADDLLTSDSKDYPQELQPRDRDRAASQTQIESIANAPNAARLGDSPETDRGAPIIGPDGRVVESGNGRVMGLRRGYERGTAEEYRAAMVARFPAAANMRNPVMVRRRVTETDARDFTVASNQSATLTMSGSETARADARLVDDDLLSNYKGGNLMSASNRGFIRAFVARLPQSAQGALVTKEGGLTIDGQRRFQAAIFQHAYADEKMLTRLTESTDDDTASLTNALVTAAPAFSRLRNAIDRGEVSANVDLSDDLRAMTAVISDLKARKMNLSDYWAQSDAFAEPNSPLTDTLLGAFYNDTGTRMVSRKAMEDFLTEYATRAAEQRTDQATLPGVEPAPIKDGMELTNDIQSEQASNRNDGTGSLFAEADPSGRGQETQSSGRSAASKRTEKRGTVDGPRREQDAKQRPLQEKQIDPDPDLRTASSTNRQSIYEQAYRDAGVDPDDGVLMPPQQKIGLLTRLFRSQFGIAVARGANGSGKGRAIDAVENLLDGWRNIQFMAHVMRLPLEAMSLGGRLNLSMDKSNRSYLGMYNSTTTTIHMPERSNSFAHEWMHALDHYLLDTLTPGTESRLFTHLTRADGLDPSDSLQAAFVNLVHKMFFTDASLAVNMMRLEQKAQAVHKHGPLKGQPTKASVKALEQLERLRSGATRIKIDPSAYRANSARAFPSMKDYYASVHEMIARAFEAYIAHKVEMAGGTTEFIAKGDKAYLASADRALALLYPKTSERLAIFSAFDDLFGHIGTDVQGMAGNAAQRPADLDILDPAYWSKMGVLDESDSNTASVKEELRRIRNGFKKLTNQPLRTSLRNGASTLAMNTGVSMRDGENNGQYVARAGQRMADIGRFYLFSLRGATMARVRRAPKGAQLFLNEMLERVMTKHGSGDTIAQTFEEAREQLTNSTGSQIRNILRSNKLENWVTGRLKKSDNDIIRDSLLGKTPAGATKQHRTVAAALRRIMDATYRRALNAGLELGYVEDTGYLPRVLLPARVNDDPDKFVGDATRLYEVVFDRLMEDISPEDMLKLARQTAKRVDPLDRQDLYVDEIQALKDAIDADDETMINDAMDDLADAVRFDYANQSALDWKTRVISGESTSFDSLGPDANFMKVRTHPKEADTIMADWYDTDVLTSVLGYVHGVEARAQYHERFGAAGGYDKIDRVLSRPEIKSAIERSPTKYNYKTAQGRLNILRDLTDVKRDNIKEMAMNEAVDQGAKSDEVDAARNAIEEITGRNRSNGMKHADRLSAALFVLGYITLLPRAAWSSVAEPLTVMMRTGDVTTTARTFSTYLREAVRGNKSVKELAALAEMIGIVSTPLHDTVLLNRLAGDHGNIVSGNTIMTRFFRANFLSQLTNAQRRAVLAGGSYWLRDMARAHADPKASAVNKRLVEREFQELGVGPKNFETMRKWLAARDKLPTMADLQTPEGKVYGAMMGRFVDQTIQNPRRADKPMLASTPMGRLAYSLMSFIFTFFENVHAATARRMKGVYEIERELGAGKAKAAASASLPALATAAGFATLFAGQFVVGTVRAALYDQEQWEKKKADDEWEEWMVKLALSRTGILGPGDVIYNAYNGLRYERDLTSLLVGATPAYIASNTQNIIKGIPGIGPRNSANTNTAEHTAAKSLYRLTAIPLVNVGLSAVPVPGGGSAVLRYSVMQYLSSNTAASAFADVAVGPKAK